MKDGSFTFFDDITISRSEIQLFYRGTTPAYIWLENRNKFYPDIYPVQHDKKNRRILVRIGEIRDYFSNISREIELKLVLSSTTRKINYNLSRKIKNAVCNCKGYPVFLEEDGPIIFFIQKQKRIETVSPQQQHTFETFLFNRKPYLFETTKFNGNPINIAVLGTCFSRNIFNTASYFNPDYKKYFNVVYTSFHNSIISLMSERVSDLSFLKIEDLLSASVFPYIETEFIKNFFQKIDETAPRYIVMDNYMNAARCVVQLSDTQFLTYNKYFSESIYKRNFVHTPILYPGEPIYEKYYSYYASLFAKELAKRGLDKRMIIIGGRFCFRRLEEKTHNIIEWENKSWIFPQNLNWDRTDKILLELLPHAQFIDMRNCSWVSDPQCPIVGGASPSHYQSGFYKELYQKLKSVIYVDFC